MTLIARSESPEKMDAPELDEAVYRRCLADLARLNRVTFTHRATLAWLDRAALPGEKISVLDVGCGHGDLLRAIAQRFPRARLMGVDLNPRSAVAARMAGGGAAIEYFTADIFAFAPPVPVDFIVTSQFTHHLADEGVVRLLHWVEAHARRGWLIADLHRHWFAYYGFPLLARLLRWHEIVRHDGQVSIARGFTRAEWRELLARAGMEAEIAWKMPFRWQVSRLR